MQARRHAEEVIAEEETARKKLEAEEDALAFIRDQAQNRLGIERMIDPKTQSVTRPPGV